MSHKDQKYNDSSITLASHWLYNTEILVPRIMSNWDIELDIWIQDSRIYFFSGSSKSKFTALCTYTPALLYHTPANIAVHAAILLWIEEIV